MTQHSSVIVVGAGAAGLMCAATAGKRGRHVLVVDHANKPGKKILMSGGGRCNFTNLDVADHHYISSNKHFCKSALSRYTQWHFLELVNQYQIPYHEKADGQLFCDNKSSDILSMLLNECDSAGVCIQLNCNIENVTKTETGFLLSTSQGSLSCDHLVMASGGLSIPTMGATGFGFDIAKQFGLSVLPYCASLVPFTLSGKLKTSSEILAGVSLPVTIENARASFSGDLLFTHRGLSGPVILQMSNYWALGEPLTVNFLPEHDIMTLTSTWQNEKGNAHLKNQLTHLLPKRFVHTWLENLAIHKPIAELSKEDRNALSHSLHHWQFTPAGTEGYRTAEVTRGGIDTNDISSKTFEAKKIPGLYFIGELLDVTGWLGGYNFQWAWASGWCAGSVV